MLAAQRNRNAAVGILGAGDGFRRRDCLTRKPGLNFLPLPPLPTVASEQAAKQQLGGGTQILRKRNAVGQDMDNPPTCIP